MIVVLAFNLIMLILLELPLLGYATRPEWTAATVERFSNWLTRRGGRVALIAGAVARHAPDRPRNHQLVS